MGWDGLLHELCKVILIVLTGQGLFLAVCFLVLILPGLHGSCNSFVLESAPWSYTWELHLKSPHHGFLWSLRLHSLPRSGRTCDETWRSLWVLLSQVLCPWQHLNFPMGAGTPVSPLLESPTEAGLGTSTPMMWVALGALHKISPQQVFCWEWGRIIYLPYCATGGKKSQLHM